MNSGHDQIPDSFLDELAAKRQDLVDALKKNGFNFDALADYLYPDTAHVIFELLQNAEDAGAQSATFRLSNEMLSFVHDGLPFSADDIDSITSYLKSGKYNNEEKIGRFGIGFKSVFACTDTPRIFSDTVAFEIVNRIVPQPISRSSSMPCKCKTLIELPFNGTMKTADEARKEILDGLNGISVWSILHLRNIKSIKWQTADGPSGCIKRETEQAGLPLPVAGDPPRMRRDGLRAHGEDHRVGGPRPDPRRQDADAGTDGSHQVVRIDAKGPSGSETRHFLRFREPYADGSSMYLDVVFELREKKQAQSTLDDLGDKLGDRFRIVPAEPGQVAVFLPATKETSNLRFHLHAPFIPEISRASIKDHKDNADLVMRLARLAAASLPFIRDQGLLDREFLGVLPNSKDPCRPPYRVFHEALVKAMRDKRLVPMHGGGHGRAPRLVQGSAEFKQFLQVDDLHFLMSDRGPSTDIMIDYWAMTAPPRRRRRSRLQGWAVAATRRNSEADRFLSDLLLTQFDDHHLVPSPSKPHSAIQQWLSGHDAHWHQTYYALLDKHWKQISWHEAAYRRLPQLPVVRTVSGKYLTGDKCHFGSGGEAPEGVAIVDPNTYTGGKNADRAQACLEQLGVTEFDEVARANAILKKHYSKHDRHPSMSEHKKHIEYFIDLARRGETEGVEFHRYALLRSCDNKWRHPGKLYASEEYSDSTAWPYFRHLKQLASADDAPDRRRSEIDSQYKDIRGFDDFAKCIGVAYKIPILETNCRDNNRWHYLKSGGGTMWTSLGIDRDWHVPDLDGVLKQAKNDREREELARAICTALRETAHTWPPREVEHARRCCTCSPTKDCDDSLQRMETNKLVAVYRKNGSHSCRTAPSQLVDFLHDVKWVPQKEDGDKLDFVKPLGVDPNRLPGGFAFDHDWAWVQAMKVASENREAAEKAKTDDLVAKAMALGLEVKSSDELERIRRFAQLPESKRNEIMKRYIDNPPPPKFQKPRNPKRRHEKATQEAITAPTRTVETRERRVVIGEEKLKEDARTKLRARYEDRARVSLCQVKDCQDRSFKVQSDTLHSDTWYFEAVRFLGLRKMIAGDYLALCPLHAAMFQYAKESKSEKLKQEFVERHASGGDDTMVIPVVLAGESVEIVLAPKHVIDLGAAARRSRAPSARR